MNYCIVAFAIIIIISTVQWFVDGRRNFTGPRTDLGLEVLEVVQSEQQDDLHGVTDGKKYDEEPRV
ncbi:hypothetical protein SLS60_008045 [Paraconiothyrium brasiliense]|uniref:Uncharacterized protein n=1 Tax=Paraconiothyrium brasiliense TaxID=300254 RepID=A0ABR3R395_9PLEO